MTRLPKAKHQTTNPLAETRQVKFTKYFQVSCPIWYPDAPCAIVPKRQDETNTMDIGKTDETGRKCTVPADLCDGV